jgi:Putative zincin peptidase
MIIPGFLISLATFPGVIVHEAAHLLFCKLRRVPVLDVCYFQLKNPSGYVIHQQPDDFLSSFLISIGPFIVNSLLCILFCFPAFFPVRMFHREDPISYFFLWLGLSIGMHAFPSFTDAKGLWQHAIQAAKQYNLLAILSLPLVCVIMLANVGRFVWLDLMYGAAIGLGLPELVLDEFLK